jgi:hypothetical protein
VLFRSANVKIIAVDTASKKYTVSHLDNKTSFVGEDEIMELEPAK